MNKIKFNFYSRFVAPYIGLGLNLPDNLMYILSIIFLSLFRGRNYRPKLELQSMCLVILFPQS